MTDQVSTSKPIGDTRFAACLAKLLRTEGGFVNDPRDRGGATNHGISLRFALAEADVDRSLLKYLDVDLDGDIDVADIRALTPELAAPLYRRCFWDKMRCSSLPAPIDQIMFDQGVNGGIVAAVKLLQRSIIGSEGVRIETDGIIGAVTIDAVQRIGRSGGLTRLAMRYRELAEDRYRTIVSNDPSQARFLGGWVTRARALGRG